MLSKTCLTKLIVLLSFAGCAGAPQFPQNVRQCSLIYNDAGTEIIRSYGFCPKVFNTDDVIRIPAVELFQKKYICVSPQDYQEITTWKELMIDWAKKHCK